MAARTTRASAVREEGRQRPGDPIRAGSNRRPDIEAWLESFGVDWEYVPAADIGDIDIKRSLANQARFKPLDDDTVQRYEIAWTIGAKFPPIVTEVNSRTTKQKMISGNHRIAGAVKAKIAQVDRYEVLDAQPSTVATMCREANNTNGLPPSEEERMTSAIFLHRSQGVPLQKAAQQYQVNFSRVQREFHKVSAAERAQAMGLDMHSFLALSQDVRGRLVTLHPDEIFAGAAALAIKAGLTINQVKDLVVQLNEAKMFAKKQSTLKAWERSLKEQIEDNLGGRKTNNSKRPITRRQRFVMAVGSIRTFGADIDGLLDTFSLNELPEFVEEIETVIENLEKFVAQARAQVA